MTGHGQKLARKQEVAIAALLAAPTIAEAAAMVGVSESTLTRWMRDTQFDQEYRAARRQAVCLAFDNLSRVCAEAVRTLESIMKDHTAPSSSRVSAARTILDTTTKVCEIEDLEARIVMLETILRAKEGSVA